MENGDLMWSRKGATLSDKSAQKEYRVTKAIEQRKAELNSHDWPEHAVYYGLRCGKLAKAPYEKCVELFKKARSQS